MAKKSDREKVIFSLRKSEVQQLQGIEQILWNIR
jgi:hypothetical protein